MVSSTRRDVVVVGSGVAGLAAAIEAAQAGGNVLVLEAQGSVGGASIMSGGASCFADTSLQRASGIEDSVELALRDWSEMGGETADLEWARQYLERGTDEVYEWCRALGVVWEAIAPQEGNSVPRWHVPSGGGRAVVEAFARRAWELGVRTVTGARVDELALESGHICGVRAQMDDGPVELAVNSVVFCSGGFAANPKMVLEHAPHLRSVPRLLAGSAPCALGAGHGVLERAGAQLVCMDHIWVYPTGTPDPRDAEGIRGLGPRGINNELWLNLDGERFHNETLRGGGSGAMALLSQPGQTAWCVFAAREVDNVLLIGNEYFGSPVGAKPEAMREFWRDSAYVRHGGTAEELADAMGLAAAAVRRSIDELNAAITDGLEIDPRFGKALGGLELIDGPLMAMQFFPLSQKNFGGVRTDLECAVLALGGEPIPGLYAAGEVAGMAGGCINGRAALEGTMFGPCIFSGRVAGQSAIHKRLALGAVS